jgi:hypothetical protein
MEWYYWLILIVGIAILAKGLYTIFDFWRRGELGLLKEEYRRQLFEMQMKRYKE